MDRLALKSIVQASDNNPLLATHVAYANQRFRSFPRGWKSDRGRVRITLGKPDIVSVKALQLALSSGEEMGYNDWDGDHFMTTTKCSQTAYAEAGITDPREQISMMEVHDCFSITELVTYEDLHISERGKAVSDAMDGSYDLDGGVPCQVDGGLKCFGHPIGASGLRMLYEMYLQLSGRAGERQLAQPRFGLTHNLGGFPFQNICSISIIGKYNQ